MSRGLLTLLLATSVCAAADWPAWRGPTGQGFCSEKGVPLKWGPKEKVKWKVELAYQGNSTPIIWRDKVFLTQANKGGSVRSLLCLARADGKLLWQKDVAYEGKERNWNENWYANASPVTDGKRVVACFGSAGVYCYDLDGNELWKRTDLGEWQHQFGNGASPVLFEGLVIQWCGPNEKKGRNFLLAMDGKNGKTKWEHEEKEGSWATPIIVGPAGKEQMVLGMGEYLKGFNPRDGKEVWRCGGLQSYVYATALVEGEYAVGMSGYNKAALAVKLGGTGDITARRLWRHERNVQRVGSGILVGGHVYMVDEDGSARCYDVKTGEDKWKDEKRRPGTIWGSLVHAEGRIYAFMRDGSTRVYRADPKQEVLAINTLGPGVQTNSSPAISNGEIFLRTFKHLYCIAE
jgi:outer membrane protein assembly factor BamB